MRVLTALFAVAALASVSMPSAMAASATDWLNKMAYAMQNESYSGVYVYIHGDRVETLQISHLKDANGEREHLLSLNGEAREVFRDNSNVVCVWPGSKSVVVSKARPRTPFSEWTEGGNIQNIENWYEMSVLGEDRVAGRNSTVIGILPKDRFRYAHKLWIDTENGLLLRSQMLGDAGQPIEQVMFTQMALNESIPAEQVVPSLSRDSGYKWTEPGEAETTPSFSVQWRFDELPAGFQQVAEKVKSIPGNPYTTHQVTLSDGLASVSVYVEQHGESTSRSLIGESKMGAISAYGVNISKVHVMVVGEVPMETATRIGRSIKVAAASQ